MLTCSFELSSFIDTCREPGLWNDELRRFVSASTNSASGYSVTRENEAISMNRVRIYVLGRERSAAL